MGSSSRKKKTPKTEVEAVKESPSAPKPETSEKEKAVKESPSAPKPETSGKEIVTPRRSRRQQDRKSKITGVGLVIDEAPTPKTNRKIVFEEEPEILVEEETQPEETVVEEQLGKEDDEDDDDDAVEEVKGNVARDEVLEQMKLEKKDAVRTKKKKKRKERKQETEKEEEDEEFDDAFFAQVDEVLTEEKQKRKQEDVPKGTHTTFVFSPEEQLTDTPKEVEHNIQVVILSKKSTMSSTANAITAVPVEPLSEAALVYSRSRLVNGADESSPTQSKKRQRKEDPSTWKRSKKMNHLSLSRARVSRRGGRGKAAAVFVTKKG